MAKFHGSCVNASTPWCVQKTVADGEYHDRLHPACFCRSMNAIPRHLFWLILLGALSAVKADPQFGDGPLTRQEAYSRAAKLEQLGRSLFGDPRLSASRQMACATCHDPRHAFGPANALAVQFGGEDMRQPGLRAVPSLKYLQVVPPFTEHYYESDEEGDDSVDNGPTGGLTWDGRVDRGRDQARIPLLSSFEMAN
ncbi:MAG TPA: cytochrome-c peroxidase, partial [Xanthobacteraceae bacterium]|nr:cytochrome-c peroxidase [Xanthobacteraceae bacterium]